MEWGPEIESSTLKNHALFFSDTHALASFECQIQVWFSMILLRFKHHFFFLILKWRVVKALAS
jgi:hypothetical protein